MRYLAILIYLNISAMASELPYKKVIINNDSYVAEITTNELLDKSINVKSISSKYSLVINGGYYDKNNAPSGYLKISRDVKNAVVSKSLSGMMVFNNGGNVELIWAKSADVNKWDNIIQNGPFVIDPGGKLGILKNDNIEANRVCIGRFKNGAIMLLYSMNISLFNLCKALHENESDLDAVLNMDGGPMAGLWSGSDVNLQNKNMYPAINYIGFQLKNGLTSR